MSLFFPPVSCFYLSNMKNIELRLSFLVWKLLGSQGWASTVILVLACLDFPVCLFHVQLDCGPNRSELPMGRWQLPYAIQMGKGPEHCLLLITSQQIWWVPVSFSRRMAQLLAICMMYFILPTDIHQFCNRKHSNKQLSRELSPEPTLISAV